MSEKTYARSIGECLIGKSVEVYCGDTGVELSYSDFSSHVKSVVRGTLVDFDDYLLIIKTKNNNEAYLNTFMVVSVVPVKNGEATEEAYVNDYRKSR